MDWPSTEHDVLRAATQRGRICALAAEGQRDLRDCAAKYPDLFPADPFDPVLFSTLSLATAFGDPAVPADRLRIANRSALWVFAVDWLIDYRARSRQEVRQIVRRCSAVAHGAPPVPGDQLTALLADVRDELATAPAFTPLAATWRVEVDRVLRAMAREWVWKSTLTEHSGAPRPTVEQYLDNADNMGSCFVNVAHWICTGEPDTLRHIDRLRRTSRAVQQVLRLLNDLASYRRDLSWGDLNVLLLGPTRTEVTTRITKLVDGCLELLRPLRARAPHAAAYLERQIGHSMGFYGMTDYWGTR